VLQELEEEGKTIFEAEAVWKQELGSYGIN